MNPNDEISRARKYMQNGDYRRARMLLERHQGKPYVDDLLRQLNRLEDDSQFQAPSAYQDFSTRQNSPTITQAPQITIQNIVSNTQNNITRSNLPLLPLFIVTLNMCLISGNLLMRNSQNVDAFSNMAVSLCFGFVGAYFLFILFWRFFWWTLAIVSIIAMIAFFAIGM